MKKTVRTTRCGGLLRDVEQLAQLSLALADGQRIKGAGFSSGYIVDIKCAREGKYGPGPCGSYVITRSGPPARALGPAEQHVGNLHGLARQLARDVARLNGCERKLPKETGFHGARRKRR